MRYRKIKKTGNVWKKCPATVTNKYVLYKMYNKSTVFGKDLAKSNTLLVIGNGLGETEGRRKEWKENESEDDR